MSSAAGKRKTDDESDSVPPSLFATIPEVCWEAVSAFASPPDVYQLCLSSAHFHTDPVRSNGKKNGNASGNTKKKSRSNNKPSSANVKSDAVLATRLLRSSLLSSLGRVLEKSESGITLKSALEMANLPEGSAIIAGSTVAATVLGEVWGVDSWSMPDVDIFCTAKAAPQVRSVIFIIKYVVRILLWAHCSPAAFFLSVTALVIFQYFFYTSQWLVQSADAIFIGFKDGYISMTDDRLLYTVDTSIHHVEHYGNLSENLEERSHAFDTPEEYVETTLAWGEDCQEEYVSWKWGNPMFYDMLGVESNNKAYDIKPSAGGSLPFDYHGDGKIDLVVAKTHDGNKETTKKTGKSSEKEAKKTEVTPFEILDDFDLTICKASFDGKTFRIPEPHLTFARKTTMEPNRCAVVESYLKHFPGTKGHMQPADQSAIASAVIKSVRKEVPDAPFYRLLDFAARIPDDLFDDPDDIFAMSNPIFQAKHGPPIQFHNWTKKLVDRLIKYQGRGIEVIDAPTVDKGVRFPKFNISPF